MSVQRVRAPGWQSPESRTEILAAGPLQIIGVGDFHQVRKPPVQVLWLDNVITLNGFHAGVDWKLTRHVTLANLIWDRCDFHP